MKDERISFLRSMNALEPRAPLATPSEPHDDDDPLVDRRPFHDVDQGPPMRIRLGFRKIGRPSYGSHLDLVRSFPRMLRRVGLPLYYSEGFRPLPKLTFGPALPVGTASLCEHVDVRLRAAESPNLENLCERLNQVALDGIEFFGCEVLGANDAALNRVIEMTDFVAALSKQELRAHGIHDEAALRVALDQRPRELFFDREIRGVKKRVDIGAVLVDLQVGAGHDAVEAAGIAGDLLPVTITLRLDGKTTPRPGEVLRALTGIMDLAPRVVRSAFFALRGERRFTPLQLEALRDKTAVQAAE
jgi:radical SAM-linked protein